MKKETTTSTKKAPVDLAAGAAAIKRADEFVKGRHYFKFTWDELYACASQERFDGLVSAFQLGYMRGYNTGSRSSKSK